MRSMPARCTEPLVLETAILNARKNGLVDAALVEEAEVQLAKASRAELHRRPKVGQLAETDEG